MSEPQDQRLWIWIASCGAALGSKRISTSDSTPSYLIISIVNLCFCKYIKRLLEKIISNWKKLLFFNNIRNKVSFKTRTHKSDPIKDNNIHKKWSVWEKNPRKSKKERYYAANKKVYVFFSLMVKQTPKESPRITCQTIDAGDSPDSKNHTENHYLKNTIFLVASAADSLNDLKIQVIYKSHLHTSKCCPDQQLSQ